MVEREFQLAKYKSITGLAVTKMQQCVFKWCHWIRHIARMEVLYVSVCGGDRSFVSRGMLLCECMCFCVKAFCCDTNRMSLMITLKSNSSLPEPYLKALICWTLLATLLWLRLLFNVSQSTECWIWRNLQWTWRRRKTWFQNMPPSNETHTYRLAVVCATVTHVHWLL